MSEENEGRSAIAGFEWFPAKRQRVLKEREIDFVDAPKSCLVTSMNTAPIAQTNSAWLQSDRFPMER